MKLFFFLKAVVRNIPGFEYIKNLHKYSGGSTLNARYCYAVWLRHLLISYNNGLKVVPKKIAELGPGDSLGVGIAALISGAEQYYAFDVVNYQPAAVNLKIFDEVVLLFKNKTAIPDEDEFPNLKPGLNDYSFPSEIFNVLYLNKILDSNRLDKIRRSIKAINDKEQKNGNNLINYFVPWNNHSIITANSIDMIISQAVLQHVNDLEATYEAMAKWLKPKGVMSHQIDFTSLGSSPKVYGHWEYSDLEWKIIKGRMTYYINREPYSVHKALLKRYNFSMKEETRYLHPTKFEKVKLAKRFRNLSTEDLAISGVFILALKE